ncbi:hypothetical protein CHLRE_08g373367v5 [Chlamydomonas reinhardtii]|uniref:Uncharacterized protein n=1 Tax=Chlamydomonas reinhardtii TaxID=3055 RepID=A0A2K3DHH1_CHLRE|nr:uncharacterized protein CHLRE_08g373367v5 [Chlamydomonas reinhardtii]PNW79974.1 hypothetical protein CHLRE_08g373367v5 [Chlamydomonas reinhardtii]
MALRFRALRWCLVHEEKRHMQQGAEGDAPGRREAVGYSSPRAAGCPDNTKGTEDGVCGPSARILHLEPCCTANGVVLDGNGLVESIVYEDKAAAKPLPEVTDSNGIGRALCSADLDPQPTDRLRVFDEIKRLSGDAIKLYASIAGLRVTAGNDMCRPRKPVETPAQAYATIARESPVWWADLERQLPWRMLDLTGQHAVVRATKAVGSTAEAAYQSQSKFMLGSDTAPMLAERAIAKL